MAKEDSPSAPDTHLIAGRYRCLKRLGVGGAGEVFKAVDLEDNKVVALKILKPQDATDHTASKRFEQEAELMREIKHPNLVYVYNFEVNDRGTSFIAMEYVSGRSLREKIYDRENPVSFEETLRLLRDVAKGCAAVHSRGIIHRDLKPDNILVTESGLAKVADFGLARLLDANLGLTNSKETVGTPHYMAPEQFQNHRVDKLADIYSFGLIAYELVAKERPFDFDEYGKIALAHIRMPLPSLSEKEANTPPWYNTFVSLCTKKAPKDRYSSMDDIVQVLERRMVKLGLLDASSVKDTRPWWLRTLSRLLELE